MTDAARRKPRLSAVAMPTIAALCIVGALLVVQMRAGRDPGLRRPVAVAARPAPRRVLLRRIVVKRVIVRVVPAPVAAASAVPPLVVTSSPAVVAAPAPAPAAPVSRPAPPLVTRQS
jgi:hypothetical protein